jgi:hypothetical protein
MDAQPGCRPSPPRLTSLQETRIPHNHSSNSTWTTASNHERLTEMRPADRLTLDQWHFQQHRLASQPILFLSSHPRPKDPDLQVCPRMDSDDAQTCTSQRQQDRPLMFCLRESQGDSQPHAPMQEWPTRGSQNQSPPRIPQTPITISHTSTDGEHDHHQPWRLVQQKWPTITLLPTDDDDPNATLHWLINEAYHNQCTIRWGHFLRGRIAKTWRWAITHYYYERRLGHLFNQHFGPAKQLTKYGQPFAPSGSAEMENCMGKTTKNNELLHYVLHENQYDASITSQRIKFQKKIPTPSMHNQSKRSWNGWNATWMHT